ncbi:MAG: hypothetical protein MJZ05_08190 [Fibrobacter sp.]|nr:hypothetical protein [Fibrobacter sp.]
MKFRVWALTAIFMALHVSAFAVENGSELSGAVSGFLKKANSPFSVKETIVVPDGKALIVEAGVEVRFDEGAGLDVRGGSIAIMGEANNPVTFTSSAGKWNGVTITGIKRSEVQGLQMSNSEYGFVVESGALEIRDAELDGIDKAAIYVRNGSADIQWSKIRNTKNIAVWATQSAAVSIDGTTLEKNRVAVVATDGSEVSFQSSKLVDNEVALLDFGDNRVKQRNTLIQGNRKGFVSKDVPDADIRRSLSGNDKDLDQGLDQVAATLGEEPRNPFADGMKLVSFKKKNSSDSVWKVSGNAGMALGYHEVMTRHHHSDTPYISDNDTITKGKRYINYFQVGGPFANWNASLLMESPDGRTFEFSADISNDTWDKFAVHNLQAIYSDRYQRAALGDIDLNAGQLYLAGINLFGASYDLNIFINSPKDPMFQISAFGGEYRAPKIVGEKNYEIYKDYVEDGEAEAQNMVAGGKIRWNMHSRFNGTLGFIGSKDFLEDPLLRDGMDADVNTSSPVMTTHNFFADGNWLFFPGDIKLNGQVAVGAADTANAAKIRAVNEVFAEQGLNSSNFSLLNKLMKNDREVNSLTEEELDGIFGENVLLTKSQKIQKLKEVLDEAKEISKKYKDHDDKPVHKDFWSYEHWAVAGSYEWSSEYTFIEGFFRYVGGEYYSAGSPDLLQNTRMIGGNLKQKINDFWKLTFGYTMNVENASNTKNGYNIFGMGEFSEWGMFSGADKDSLREHWDDRVRALYIHNAYLGNSFKINDKVNLDVKYSVDYRTRSTPQKLQGDYAAESKVYDDPWFQARKDQPTVTLRDTMEIDSARWAQYYELRKDSNLANQFDERLLKHVAELGVTVNLPNNVLRIGGAWVYRTDLSKFVNDSNIKDLKLSNESFGILGYYFHGGDFFEQRYPISLSTKIDNFRNSFAFTPRYKIYNRNDMTEFEWTVADNMSFPISEDFLDLTLNGSVRQNFLKYKNDGVKFSEMELDIDGSAALRIHHTPSLYTDWTVGAVFNYRPDNRADEYKDLYFIAALNYDF